MAPIMAELVPRLRRFQEPVITDDAEPAMPAMSPMSPARLDRRLAPDRAKLLARGPAAHQTRVTAENRSRSDVGGMERRRAGVTGPSMGTGQNGGSSGSTRRPSVGGSVTPQLGVSGSLDPP